MIIKKNFVSCITLGSFNPAILTPKFLIDQRVWVTEEKCTGKSTPVVSELKFGDISFFAELERFQVIHHNPEDFSRTPIIEATYNYLDKLKYTPLHLQGINLNVTLEEYDENLGIKNIFTNPILGISKYINSDKEYLIDTKSEVKQNKIETVLINCKYYIDDGFSLSISMKKIDKGIVLNFNSEIERLNQDRSRIGYIKENYKKILNMFDNFLEKLL